MPLSSWIRRQFKNGVSTTDYIPGGLTAGATSWSNHDGTTFPDGSIGPFMVTVDQGLATEERILVTTRSGASFSGATRGYNNTTAQSHSANCTIYHTMDQQDLDEANQTMAQTVGAIAAKGDLLVGSAANTLVKVSIGSAAQLLTVQSGTIGWQSFGSGGTTSIANAGADGTSVAPARYDHTHAGVTSVQAGGSALQGVVTGLVDTTNAQTLTNKRNTRRVVTVTQSATPTMNTDNMDVASITGLAQAITSMTTNLSGTPVDGDLLIVRITDNGTARAITWGASFESSGNVGLPTTTVISTMLAVGFLWNTVTAKWRCIALA